MDKVKANLDWPSSMSDNEFITKNFVNRSPIRLTKQGLANARMFRLFDHEIKAIIHPPLKITPKRLTWLIRRSEAPFYLDQAWLYTFDKKMVVHIGLVEKDLSLFFPK